MSKPRMLSLCSGIGGIDLAWEWAGGEIAGQVEIDAFCRAVLAKHWPGVRRMEDIRDVRGDEFGRIDLLAGGIPCQGNSVAGARRGRSDDRYLWPEMARLVRATGAEWVLVENVPGMRSVDGGELFADVVRDLAVLGYRVGWLSLEAAEVGAPHKRERVFIVGCRASVADAQRLRRERREGGATGEHEHAHEWAGEETATQPEATGKGIELADATVGNGSVEPDGTDAPGTLGGTIARTGGRIGSGCSPARVPRPRRVEQHGALAVADADEHRGRWAQRAGPGDLGDATGADARREGHPQWPAAECGRATVADASGSGWRPGQHELQARQPNAEGRGELADATHGGLRRGWASGEVGQLACGSEDVEHTRRTGWEEWHAPAEPGSAGHPAGRCDTHGHDGGQTEPRLGGVSARIPGRLDFPGGWHGWPAGPQEIQAAWEPPRTVAGTVPHRAARLKALGNAIVPQQVYPILAAIRATFDEGEATA